MTDTAQPAVLTSRQDHILIVTINRPEARNAVNAAVHVGLGEGLEQAEADPDIRAVIVTGAGDQAFCAGADLKALSRGERLEPEDKAQRAWGFAGFVQHPIGKPIIAAAGGAFRIVQQLPRKIAMQLLLTGEPISAQRALDLGLANEVVPLGKLLDTALDFAESIAVNAPLAVQASKRIAMGIAEGRIASDEDFWEANKRETRLVITSEDSREGPRAFAEKRQPVWQAR